jgi:hypothetical protein
VYVGSNRSDITRVSGLEALAKVATLRELTIALDGPLELPPAVFTLRPLTRLSLRGRWSALPDELGALTQLLELELQLPHLHELPESIGRLHDLRRLLLRDCRLRRLPDSVGELAQLVDLFAEDNRLRRLPESVARLSALERLLLDGNRLREVPESLAALPRLRLLSLTRNDALDEVPQPLAARDGLSLEVEPEKLPLLVRESVEEASERAFSTLEASARAKERPAWTLQLDDAHDDQHEASVGGAMWLAPHESTPRCGICDASMSPFLQLDLAMTGEHTGLLQVWGCGDAPSPTRLRQLAEQDDPTVSEVYREHLRAFFTLVPEAAWDGLIERARAWTTTPADRALLELARLSGNTLEYTLRFTCRVLSSSDPCAYVFARIVDRAERAAPCNRRIAARVGAGKTTNRRPRAPRGSPGQRRSGAPAQLEAPRRADGTRASRTCGAGPSTERSWVGGPAGAAIPAGRLAPSAARRPARWWRPSAGRTRARSVRSSSARCFT